MSTNRHFIDIFNKYKHGADIDEVRGKYQRRFAPITWPGSRGIGDRLRLVSLTEGMEYAGKTGEDELTDTP